MSHSGTAPIASAEPLLTVAGIEVVYRGRRVWPWKTVGRVRAVSDLSFTIDRGETFALVGESGSGKSTVARAVQGLVPVRSGRVLFEGRDVTQPIGRRDSLVKKRMQIVFQNPDASLNPRHSVATIIGRPLAVFHNLSGVERRSRASDLLADAQLDDGYLRRMPGQLSGGERQRVAIARALAAEPELLLCDEILSALDVSVQASVIELLHKLQRQRGLAYLFISHDLSVVRWLAHRVAVLFAGALCETGPVDRVFQPPYHPYTENLLMAVPRLAGVRRPLPPPVAEAEPERINQMGCLYAHRCPRRIRGVCDSVTPPVQRLGEEHEIRCHVPIGELAARQRDLSARIISDTPATRPADRLEQT